MNEIDGGSFEKKGAAHFIFYICVVYTEQNSTQDVSNCVSCALPMMMAVAGLLRSTFYRATFIA